ncbi:hypothetical protein [Frigidibacter sp. ROC022]|uniref:hypothetical protein n=1 Tax=Frigidibacter sp. ROC022 TaxID=2971796 RepID=UPI00215A1986|nr:hypothetical protein [Frigidibacter sp. ROC022]MCR8725083.1 hypothetical protein [Frigidibacter sp. ROC022]
MRRVAEFVPICLSWTFFAVFLTLHDFWRPATMSDRDAAARACPHLFAGSAPLRGAARRGVFKCLEFLYNPERTHNDKGILSPFESRQWKLNKAAARQPDGCTCDEQRPLAGRPGVMVAWVFESASGRQATQSMQVALWEGAKCF